MQSKEECLCKPADAFALHGHTPFEHLHHERMPLREHADQPRRAALACALADTRQARQRRPRQFEKSPFASKAKRPAYSLIKACSTTLSHRSYLVFPTTTLTLVLKYYGLQRRCAQALHGRCPPCSDSTCMYCGPESLGCGHA